MQHLKNKQSYSERPLRWNVSLEIIFHLTLTYDEKNLSDFKSSTNLSNFHLKIFVCDTMKLQRCSETRIFWINHFLKSLTTVIYCKAFLLYCSKHTTSCVYWSVSNWCPRKRLIIFLLSKAKLLQLWIISWKISEYLFHIITWNPAHCTFSLVLFKFPMLFGQW